MNFKEKIKQAEQKIKDVENKLFIDGVGQYQRGCIFNGRPMPKEEQDKLKKEYIKAYAELSCINMDLRDAQKEAEEHKKKTKKQKPKKINKWTRYSPTLLPSLLFYDDWVYIGSEIIGDKTFYKYEKKEIPT